MSTLFKLFRDTKSAASMICIKNKETGNYDCKLGFDYESKLFANNNFKHKQNFSQPELENCIEKLGAIDTHDVTDVKRWVLMENPDNIDVYNFGGSAEIHIIKQEK